MHIAFLFQFRPLYDSCQSLDYGMSRNVVIYRLKSGAWDVGTVPQRFDRRQVFIFHNSPEDNKS